VRSYFVYILANRTRRMYVGATSDLAKRVWQHRHSPHPHFTRRYNITALVYFELVEIARTAVARERQIKGWSRARKLALVDASNPEWRDLMPDV
jgi:putative endonuclease